MSKKNRPPKHIHVNKYSSGSHAADAQARLAREAAKSKGIGGVVGLSEEDLNAGYKDYSQVPREDYSRDLSFRDRRFNSGY